MRVVEGRAYVRGNFEQVCIGIEDGRISAIKKTIKGDPHHDFGANYIIPAGIDIHVHFRDPGMTHKEDFRSGTEAAACGGVSCVFDMPNTVPATTDVRSLDEKLEEVRNRANVDFGLYAVATERTRLDELLNRGCPLKIYMAGTTGGLRFGDYVELARVLKETGEKGTHVSVHCEDQGMIHEDDADTLEGYLDSRPGDAEASAINEVSRAAGESKFHVCHVSAKESIPLLDRPNITSEVTPNHVLLNATSDLSGFGKVTPPLRRRGDQVALWDALVSGRIDAIASDHAPHTIEEKEQEFGRAPPGIPGVETTLPLMLVQVRKRNLPMDRLVSAMMEKPAELMGLMKGRIEIGMDADLIVVDMKNITRIKAETLHSRCGWTPYEKQEAIFPIATFLRGELIARDSEIQEIRKGKFVGAE